MLKKVLSVVLALVLALGVCAVAASAATASQLEAILNRLPSETTAQYYNDATEAKILAVREAAYAALESGNSADINKAYALCQLEDILLHLPTESTAHYYKDATEAKILAAREVAYAALESDKVADITAAYNQCQAAYDEAWASEEVEYDDEGNTCAVFYNRDESKAHATLYYETDAPDYLMPGDTFDVTFSIKTDFPLRQFRVSFAYDYTILEANETPETKDSSISFNSDMLPLLDTTTHTYHTRYGWYNDSFVTTRQNYPIEWDSDMIAKYSFIEKEFTRNYKTRADNLFPTEKTEIFTVSMKVRDNAPIGSTADIFVCPEMCANMENDYLFPGTPSLPIKIFRAFSTDPHELFADIDNRITDSDHIVDVHTGVGQTITWEGSALKTYHIGEAPAALNYDDLQAAVDEIEDFTAADYTEDSWKAYEDAVAAGAEELTAKALETQDEIDALTKTVTDARDALVEATPEEKPAEILNITELTVPVVGKYTELEVLVDKPVKKIQFVDVNGNTTTYYDGYSRTLDIKNNEDGTQTWTVKLMSRAAEESYDARVKNLDTSWSEKYYTYNATIQTSENTIFSAEVPDAYDGRLKYGTHNLVITTSTDVSKVQVIYTGTTATYTPSSTKATVEEVDGKLVWTIKFNFFKSALEIPYNFASRSTSSAWKTSEDVSLVLDVLH